MPLYAFPLCLLALGSTRDPSLRHAPVANDTARPALGAGAHDAKIASTRAGAQSSRILDHVCRHSPVFCAGFDEIPRALLSNLGLIAPNATSPSLLLGTSFNFGRTNNIAQSLSHVILMATLPCVDFERAPALNGQLYGFDWAHAVEKWAPSRAGCTAPKRVAVDSGELFFVASGHKPAWYNAINGSGPDGASFPASFPLERHLPFAMLHNLIMADILAPTLAALGLAKQALAKLPRRFLAIHLRQLESSHGCDSRMGGYLKQCQTDSDATSAQICSDQRANLQRRRNLRPASDQR